MPQFPQPCLSFPWHSGLTAAGRITAGSPCPAPRLTRPAGSTVTALLPNLPCQQLRHSSQGPTPAPGTGGTVLGGRMASVPRYCHSLLQAPASSGTRLCLKSPVKALVNPLWGISSPCLHPSPAQGSPNLSILPLEAQPNPAAPTNRLGAELWGCSAIPRFLGGIPPHSQPAIPTHSRSEDPSAGSRQVEAGSCLPWQPRQAPRGLIPACKY